MGMAVVASVDMDGAGLDPGQLLQFGDRRPQGVPSNGARPEPFQDHPEDTPIRGPDARRNGSASPGSPSRKRPIPPLLQTASIEIGSEHTRFRTMRGVRSCNFHRSSGFVFVKGMQEGEGDEQTFGLGETTVHSPSPRDP
jgi:hypothetical protein